MEAVEEVRVRVFPNPNSVAKTPVVGLPRPMEIGPQTPEEVKAKFGDRRKL